MTETIQQQQQQQQAYKKLTGRTSTAPLRGFLERTVPVTLGVVVVFAADDVMLLGL
jgi:hypothetical protein